MNRYEFVYMFLALFMAALVYLIGMPWKSKGSKTDWDSDRQDYSPRT